VTDTLAENMARLVMPDFLPPDALKPPAPAGVEVRLPRPLGHLGAHHPLRSLPLPAPLGGWRRRLGSWRRRLGSRRWLEHVVILEIGLAHDRRLL